MRWSTAYATIPAGGGGGGGVVISAALGSLKICSLSVVSIGGNRGFSRYGKLPAGVTRFVARS